jgi:predicted nuclease with TOPRIM domain
LKYPYFSFIYFQLDRATDLLEKYEQSNVDLKNKLAESIKQMNEESLKSQDIIQSLEVKNASLMDDMKLMQSDQEMYLKELHELKRIIKTYEDHVDKISENQHRTTQDFIHDIHIHKARTDPHVPTGRHDRPSHQEIVHSIFFIPNSKIS